MPHSDIHAAYDRSSASEVYPLQWRHNDHDSVSNHQPHDRLLNRLFGRRSKKTSKLGVTGFCVVDSSGTGEIPAQIVEQIIAYVRRIVQIMIQATDLAQILYRGHSSRKKRGPRKISIWPPFSKMAATGYPETHIFCLKRAADGWER